MSHIYVVHFKGPFHQPIYCTLFCLPKAFQFFESLNRYICVYISLNQRIDRRCHTVWHIMWYIITNNSLIRQARDWKKHFVQYIFMVFTIQLWRYIINLFMGIYHKVYIQYSRTYIVTKYLLPQYQLCKWCLILNL